MKYKLFDAFITQNSEHVNIMLKKLTMSFNHVIGCLKSTDVNFNIRRGFLDNGKIFIYVYYEKQKLFSCKFNVNDNNVLILYTKYINWYKIDTSAVEEVLKLIEKYTISIKPFGASEVYAVPLKSVHKLIDEFDMYISSDKYNL